MSNLEPVCAVAAGVLSGSCAIPYVRDMVRGTTRPHRVSWGIFALLAAIAAASQLMHGFTTGAVLSLGAAVAFFIVFVMSMRHGVGGATLADRLTLAGTVGILVVWAWSGDTTVAVTLVIVFGGGRHRPDHAKGVARPRQRDAVELGDRRRRRCAGAGRCESCELCRTGLSGVPLHEQQRDGGGARGGSTPTLEPAPGDAGPDPGPVARAAPGAPAAATAATGAGDRTTR